MANLIQPIAIHTDIPVAEEESLTVKCEPQSTMDTFEGQEWPQFSIASSADDFKQRVSERDKQIALFREREKNKANFLRQRSIAKIRRTEEFLRQREGMKKKARLINDMHAKERAHLKELLREKSFTKSISNHAKLLSNTDRHLARVEVGLCKSGGKLPLVKFVTSPAHWFIIMLPKLFCVPDLFENERFCAAGNINSGPTTSERGLFGSEFTSK